MQDTTIDPMARRPSAHPTLSSSRVVEMMDRAVARVLFVQPRPLVPRQAVATTGSRPFETPLLIAGVRCTLRYIVLPFVLPLLGVATGAALGTLLTLDVIAAIAIVSTLRRLWRLQHSRRWQYLPVALTIGGAGRLLPRERLGRAVGLDMAGTMPRCQSSEST